jgi:PEGA domain-containing protein
MHRFFSGSVALTVASALVSSCASTTVIRSNPSGAIVRDIRGQKVGKTPYTYTGTGTINSQETFSLEKPGYEDATVIVKRDQVNGLAVAGWAAGGLLTSWTIVGLGLFAGILWSADYAPAYNVELEPAPAPAAQAVTVSPAGASPQR